MRRVQKTPTRIVVLVATLVTSALFCIAVIRRDHPDRVVFCNVEIGRRETPRPIQDDRFLFSSSGTILGPPSSSLFRSHSQGFRKSVFQENGHDDSSGFYTVLMSPTGRAPAIWSPTIRRLTLTLKSGPVFDLHDLSDPISFSYSSRGDMIAAFYEGREFHPSDGIITICDTNNGRIRKLRAIVDATDCVTRIHATFREDDWLWVIFRCQYLSLSMAIVNPQTDRVVWRKTGIGTEPVVFPQSPDASYAVSGVGSQFVNLIGVREGVPNWIGEFCNNWIIEQQFMTCNGDFVILRIKDRSGHALVLRLNTLTKRLDLILKDEDVRLCGVSNDGKWIMIVDDAAFRAEIISLSASQNKWPEYTEIWWRSERICCNG